MYVYIYVCMKFRYKTWQKPIFGKMRKREKNCAFFLFIFVFLQLLIACSANILKIGIKTKFVRDKNC